LEDSKLNGKDKDKIDAKRSALLGSALLQKKPKGNDLLERG